MSFKKIGAIFFVLFFIACESNDPGLSCLNDQSELLGEWELQSRAINGITSGAAECCETIEFSAGAAPESCTGNFRYLSNGQENTGTFEVNDVEGTIRFILSNRNLIYRYLLVQNTLTFEYTDNAQTIVESWVRSE